MDRTKALKLIRTAWIAGIVSAVVTLLITIADMNGAQLLGFNAYALVDVAIIAGLTAGVAAKSRVCAVLLLGHFVLNKVVMWTNGVHGGYFTGFLFVWFYWQGVRGTFAWHEAGASGAPSPQPAAAPDGAGGPRFRTREEYEAWKASRMGGPR